jgi:hypothetical protein
LQQGKDLGTEAIDVLQGARAVAGTFDQKNQMVNAGPGDRVGERVETVIRGADSSGLRGRYGLPSARR